MDAQNQPHSHTSSYIDGNQLLLGYHVTIKNGATVKYPAFGSNTIWQPDASPPTFDTPPSCGFSTGDGGLTVQYGSTVMVRLSPRTWPLILPAGTPLFAASTSADDLVTPSLDGTLASNGSLDWVWPNGSAYPQLRACIGILARGWGADQAAYAALTGVALAWMIYLPRSTVIAGSGGV